MPRGTLNPAAGSGRLHRGVQELLADQLGRLRA
jgi:hypothetical protein